MTIFFFLATLLTLTDKKIFDPLALAFYAFILGLLVDRLFESIHTAGDQERLERSYQNVLASVESSYNIQRIGGRQSLNSYLEKKLENAAFVRNTFIGSGFPSTSLEASDPEILNAYTSFFENGGRTWIDAVGINEISGPRFNDIQKPENTAKKYHHIVYLVRHSIPVINFTIIDYDDINSEREVIFGWQYAPAADNVLFRSRDPHLVGIFINYFHNLTQYSIDQFDINYEAAETVDRLVGSSGFVDRHGCWATIGFEGDKVKSLACFDITFENHNARISGEAIWVDKYQEKPNKRGIEDINHTGDKLSYTDRKIFLEYGNKYSGRRGICVYKFQKKNRDDRIDGYLQDDGEKGRVQLLGLRLAPQPMTESTSTRDNLLNARARLDALAAKEGLRINWDALLDNEGKEDKTSQ